MNIIGWIRKGDAVACGGTVAEGLSTCTGRGIPYSFQGARIACRKNCVIAEGYAPSTLANGHSRVVHGMKTSGGCPLHSTLNGIDGVGNGNDETCSVGFIQAHDGTWVGNTAGVSAQVRQALDEQFRLLDGQHRPLLDTYYTAKLASGEMVHGITDHEGKTHRFHSADAHYIQIFLGHLDH